jgi:hypothetical protein
MSQSAIDEYMKVYPVFKDRMSQKDFKSHIKNINWEDGSFLRASSLLMLSQKCAKCERTLAMALLCSAIEAMTPKGKQVPFADWLLKNKLDTMAMKNENELRKAIKSAYQDFLKKPDREGAFYNFKQFLLNNCPEELRTPPIEKAKTNISFEKALGYIYGEFRSLFLHEGLSYASYKVPNKFVHIEVKHIKIVNGKLLFFNLIKILPWFSNVVKESLCNYLIKNQKLS